ncbi:hypothetical protein V6Z69_20740 [Cereibacter sphaeroides]|uniref:hypothetical protein n=1 Tax=Cereibacter sphaeroides TaxID=1063 RepID=UPI0039908FF3
MPFDHQPHSHLYAAQTWLAAHGMSAVNAARLLGGPTAAAGVHRLIDDLRQADSLSRLARLKLAALHRLLTLEGSDQDPLPAMLPLHPGDPRVLDICLLADSLSDLLSEITPKQAVAI